MHKVKSQLKAIILFSLLLTVTMKADIRTYQNLAGDWQAGASDSLKLELPAKVKNWQTEQVPAKNGSTTLLKTTMGPYMPPPTDLLTKDGKRFKKSEELTSWFKREFTVKKSYLSNRYPVLHLGGAAYRSAIWLNGTKISESVQACTPFDIPLKNLKAGKNEIIIATTDREGLVDIKTKSYISPSNGVRAGVREAIQINYLPKVHVEDVFIKTSVKNKRIAIELTIFNSTTATAMIKPFITIKEQDLTSAPLKHIAGEIVSLKAGEHKTVTISANWLAPRLWEVDNAHMYNAEISLSGKSTTVDKIIQPFGFREFEIKGRDFLLNGTRIVLIRNSSLSQIGAENPYKTEAVYNCMRLHLGFNNMIQIKRANKDGVMIIPESGWSWVRGFPKEHKAVWLKNTKEYYRRWIKQQRNEPSVIMWSLANETYWDRRDPEELAIAKQLLEIVRDLDPTRPQQGDGECSWDGMLPTTNIHYPESTAGTIGLKYPNSGRIIPNDFYWLKEEGMNESWRAKFIWDRPLMMGEYYHAGGSPEGFTSYMGDTIYDWERWRREDLGGRYGQSGAEYNNGWIESLKKITDIYRMQGVACINPWSGDRSQIMQKVTTRPIDFFPNFKSGEKGTRTMVVINDSRNNFSYPTLQCFITVDGKTVWQDKIRSNTGPGQINKFKINFELPEVAKLTKAKFTARFLHWRAGGFHQLSRHEEEIFIIPENKQDNVDGKIVVFSKNPATAKALKALNIKAEPVKQLSTAALKGKKLVIIGANSFSATLTQVLDEYVTNGGRVLILPQEKWQPYRPELPEADTRHAASQTWIRAAKHPILKNMEEKQFSYWHKDNLISINTFVKPTAGCFNILLDCGGRYGLNWSPLLTVSIGTGEYVLSSIDLCGKAPVEPAAGYLLGNIIDYCVKSSAKTKSTLNLICGDNQPLKDSLNLVGAVSSSGAGKEGVIMVDSSAGISKTELSKLKAALKSGRRIWLHGFTPETISKVKELFPFNPKLTKPDPSVQSCIVKSDNRLMSGLSNYEFYWTRVNPASRKDFFQNGKPTAKTGDWILECDDISIAEKLIEPGFMYNITCGKGEILFDTLQWENAFNTESEKAGRLLASILSNIGVDLKLKPEVRYDFFHVDLKEFANMGYYDKVEGDKKGGWTDGGGNDMRFFLINHTGRMDGRDDGAEVGVEEFPQDVKLAKTSFAVIDPKKNNDKTVLAFRGGPHGEFLLEKAGPVPVNKKAEMFWFLHAGCWISATPHILVAEYIVEYDDGSKIKIPVRTSLEVTDWWNPTPLPNAKVAWTGRNLKHSPVGIWSMPWENPHPEKNVKAITIEGNKSDSQLVLLAITGGNKAEGENKSWNTMAEWDLTQNSEKTFTAKYLPDATLKFYGKNELTVTDKGYRSGVECSLNSNTKYFPEWNQKPFGLEVTITPTEKPAGYFGGLFQAMQYGKSGFRLMLRHDMKLAVEIYTGSSEPLYITGNTVMEPNRTYTVGLTFDGRKAVLTLNGRPEKIIDSPLPVIFKGGISIGRASGKDYYFNGAIKKVALLDK